MVGGGVAGELILRSDAFAKFLAESREAEQTGEHDGVLGNYRDNLAFHRYDREVLLDATEAGKHCVSAEVFGRDIQDSKHAMPMLRLMARFA